MSYVYIVTDVRADGTLTESVLSFEEMDRQYPFWLVAFDTLEIERIELTYPDAHAYHQFISFQRSEVEP